MRAPTSRSAGERRERTAASTQFRDGVFHNTAKVTPGLKGNPLPLLGEYFFGGANRVPKHPLPLRSPLEAWGKPPDSKLRVTWLGHSTVVLELGGARVLTDPVFGRRASPFGFMGPERFHPVPVTFEQLPALDAVLLSHDHYDHLCAETMRALAKSSVPIITSLGVGAHLEALGVDSARIHELDWWQRFELPTHGVSFTATPSQHFSGRGALDRNTTLWSSWVLESDHQRVFFSGDTGLTEELKTIRAKFGAFDLVMLEVGAFNQAWADIHLGPDNAATAFEWLGGGTLLPVHWGTFNLALHPWDEPAERLTQLAQERHFRFLTPELGQVFEPSQVERFAPWWRALGEQRVEAAVPSRST